MKPRLHFQFLAATLVVAFSADADEFEDDGLPPPPECPGTNMLEVRVLLESPDTPLTGCRVRIEAGRTRLVRYDRWCQEHIYSALADLPVEWALLSWPTGPAPEFSGASTRAALALPREGRYVVRFTVCPNGNCSVLLGTGPLSGPYTISNAVHAYLQIDATNSLPIAPEVYPALPASVIANATAPTAFDPAALWCECTPGGGGFVNPQWITVGTFDPNAPYAQIEGGVFNSWMSHMDLLLNHSQAGSGNVMDVNFRVDLDPPYRWRVATRPEFDSPYVLGVEWERTSIPEHVRPLARDRVSVWGIWIHDCGHAPFYTEIHPAVGLAVMRPRPIQLPSSQVFRFETPTGFVDATVGQNVWVPGIVTDLWFNGHAGEITGNCSTTGLHQPGTCDTNANGQVIFPDGDCVRGPHPINRFYSFNIYLPRNPRVIACEHGLDLPEPPLFIQTNNPYGSGGPDPVVQVVREPDGAVYLRVTLDLTGYSGREYSRRITAGWVYPAPDNWGLQRLRVRLDKLVVHDDKDTGSDGDWGLWVQLPNVNQEWTRVLDGISNAHGVVTFNPPWQTGSQDPLFWRPPGQVDPSHALGADVMIIPPFHASCAVTAYESDSAWHDDPGRAYFPLVPGGDFRVTSDQRAYTSHGALTALTPPTPILSSAAAQLYSLYKITCANAIGWRPPIAVADAPLTVDTAVVPGIGERDTRAWQGRGQAGGRFGLAMAGGDFDGDGASDLFVSEPGNGEGAPAPRVHFHRSQIVMLPPSPTWTMGGPASGNGFGEAMASAGDVNGDGLPDLIVGSPRFDLRIGMQTRTNVGAAYLWLGRSNLSTAPLFFTNYAWSAVPASTAFTEAGFAVAGAGDVNGDGLGDVIIGAPGWNNGVLGVPRGRALLYHGSATGLATSVSTALIPPPLAFSEIRFSAVVAGVGDINGDGFDDVAVGAPEYQNGQASEGAVFIYLGGASGVGTNAHGFFQSDWNGARLGAAVAGAGDVNGDGFADVLAGAPDLVEEIGGPGGAAYLYLGGAGGLGTWPAWIHYGVSSRARFGAALAGVGDLDQDGYDDVIVGAPDDVRTKPNEGTVAMFRGRSSALGLSVAPDWEEAGIRQDAQLGAVVAAAGDVNHDGSPDFAYAALHWPGCDADRGTAWLQFGQAPRAVRPDDLRFMRAVGEEPIPWLDPNLPDLAQRFAAADSNRLAVVLAELRAALDAQVMNTELEQEAMLRLAPLAAAAPTNLWNQHFGDLVFDTGSAWWVDCGATDEHRDALGRVWTPDVRFLENTAAPHGVVTQTVDDSLLTDRHVPNELLQSERRSSTNLRYAVPVRPGRYRVVLYFAETCLTCVGPAWGGTGCEACSRVFDVEYEGMRTNDINPADRAIGDPLDGVGATMKATELVSAPFDIHDGVFDLTLFDRGAGNPPGNPAIKGFALLRLPPAGRSFNPPHLDLTDASFGPTGTTNLTLVANLKGHLNLAQAGLATVRLESSEDLVNWQPTGGPPTSIPGAVRFTVPRSGSGQRFYRVALDLSENR